MAGRAEHRLDGIGVEPARLHLRAQLGGRLSVERAGRCGRGSHIAWYASAAAEDRASREIAVPTSPRG